MCDSWGGRDSRACASRDRANLLGCAREPGFPEPDARRETGANRGHPGCFLVGGSWLPASRVWRVAAREARRWPTPRRRSAARSATGFGSSHARPTAISHQEYFPCRYPKEWRESILSTRGFCAKSVETHHGLEPPDRFRQTTPREPACHPLHVLWFDSFFGRRCLREPTWANVAAVAQLTLLRGAGRTNIRAPFPGVVPSRHPECLITDTLFSGQARETTARRTGVGLGTAGSADGATS